MRHTFTRKSTQLFEDNLLQLPSRRFSYRGARVVTCIRGAGGGAAAAAVGGEGPGGTGETGEAGEAGGACVGSARREAEARLDGLPG